MEKLYGEFVRCTIKNIRIFYYIFCVYKEEMK